MEDSELFISPQIKQKFGWVTVGILLVYIAVHMGLFAGVLFLHCKRKVKERCCKPKLKQPEKKAVDEAES